MVTYSIEIRCGTCPDTNLFRSYASPPTEEDAKALAAESGWQLYRFFDGRYRGQCAACLEAPPARRARAGFTLVELLVVLLICAIVFVVAAPVVITAREAQRVSNAAQLVQGAIVEGQARAQTKQRGGFRLLPDATLLKRLADGSIDPDAPLAFDRVQQLEQPPGYSEGRVAIYTPATGFPAPFGSSLLPGRLVLEQEPRDEAGLLASPTAWAWNVRLGDRVEVLGQLYAVAGPMAKGPAEGNVERMVNYDPTWPVLDRDGDGVPAEWLYLTNMKDDDGDGYADNGFDGIDQDLDKVVDGPGEWTETERWGTLPAGDVRQLPYTLHRRPVPIASGTLPLAGAVIDATGWAASPRVRSRLPVDPWSGTVDVTVDASGRWTPIRSVGVPSADGLGSRFLHLWIANREDVDAPAAQAGSARLLTIDANSGRTSVRDADATNPAAAIAEAEGRSR